MKGTEPVFRLLLLTARAMAIVAAAAVVVLMSVTVVDVVGRMVLPGFYVPGAIELSVISLIVLAFFGLPWSFATDQHVRVELMAASSSARVRKALDFLWLLLSGAVAGGFAFRVLRTGIDLHGTGQVTETLRISPLAHHGVCAAGLFVTLTMCIALFSRHMRNAIAGHGTATPKE